MDFWQALDLLVAEHDLVIDRPRGTAHPRYSDYVYPLDYGYLRGTASSDGGGIDVWRGSSDAGVVAVMVTVDLVKRDSEIKILLGCTEEEIAIVNREHNNSEFMKGILIRREGNEL
ncbi:MAG: inorganic pyrophosphatase [Oscillospiraceae bacterium]|jgi:inorganic pyrophosphatase|nr:inorganic pyrophosphatase [Oscillospiraceae bacterium]